MTDDRTDSSGSTSTRTDGGRAGDAGPRPSRTLTRSSTERMLAGVAGGIARYTDSPPALWRILFVVTAFAGGLGIVAYGAAWLLLPEDTDPVPPHERAPKDLGTWIGIGLVALAALIVVDRVSVLRGGLFLPAVLVIAGVLIWQSGQRDQAPPPPPAPPHPTSTTSPTGATPPSPTPPSPTTSNLAQNRTDMSATQELPPAPPTPPTPPATSSGWTPPPTQPPARGDDTGWTPPPAQERHRSGLGRIVVALILVMVGTAAILDNLAVIDVSVATVLAIALVMVGLGLIVGTWWGRARGLIALGILLVPLVAVSGLANLDRAPLHGGVGDRRYEPVAVVDLQDTYRLAAGQLTLDLTDVDFSGHAVDVDASVAFGALDVRVPRNVRVEVDGQVGVGDVRLFAVQDSGIGVERTVVDDDTGDGTSNGNGTTGTSGTLRLHLNAGLGEIRVRRAGQASLGMPSIHLGAGALAPTVAASTTPVTTTPSEVLR